MTDGVCNALTYKNMKIQKRTHTIVHFAIKVDKEKKEKINAFLKKQKNIRPIENIEFGHDFLCKGKFEDCQKAEEFFIILFSNFHIIEFEKYYIDNKKR